MSASVIEARERCFAIIERFPPWQLSNLAETLEAALKLSDEVADELFCKQLYRDAKADPENTESISIEKYADKWGIDLTLEDADED